YRLYALRLHAVYSVGISRDGADVAAAGWRCAAVSVGQAARFDGRYCGHGIGVGGGFADGLGASLWDRLRHLCVGLVCVWMLAEAAAVAAGLGFLFDDE